MPHRSGSALHLVLLGVALVSCGERGRVPPSEDVSVRADGRGGSPPRAAAPAAPAADDATRAAVGRLAVEWCDPPEGRDRDEVVAELATFGAEGLERLILAAAEDPAALRELVRDLADALGDDAVPVFAKVLRERTGTARWIAACDVPGQWPWLTSGPDAARALLVALGDEDVETRRQVLEQLGRAGPTGTEVAQALVGRLDSEDLTEAGAAFEALEELGPHAASVFAQVATHARTFGDDPDDAARLLSAIGPATEEDRRLVLSFLGSDDAAHRRAALECMVEHPHLVAGRLPEVLPHLFEVDLKYWDEAEAIRELAQFPGVAGEFLTAVPGLPQERVLVVLDALHGHEDAEVLKAIRAAATELLRSPSPEIRASAIPFLRPREDDSIDFTSLRALLDDPSPAVRAAAARALSSDDPVSHDRAVASARELLATPEGRHDAAVVLAREIDPDAPPADWVALLADRKLRWTVVQSLLPGTAPLGRAPDGVVASLVADALDEDGNPDAARVAVRFEGGTDALLARALANLRSTDDDVALDALETLAAVAPHVRSALPQIREALGDRSFSAFHGTIERADRALAALIGGLVEAAADFEGDVEGARRLLAFGEPGARALLGACDGLADDQVSDLAEALRGEALVGSAILAAAVERVADPDEDRLRRGALRLAPALGVDRAILLCAQIASGAEPRARLEAIRALGRIGSKGDLRPAEGAIRRALADDGEALRREACAAAGHLSSLLSALRERLDDSVPVVRFQAAAMILRRVASDEDARRALLDVLAAAEEEQQLYYADWDAVGGALGAIPLDAAVAPALARALREVDDCAAQQLILRALPRLGPAAAPALAAVRLALADELGCVWGLHDNPCRPDAIAALAALGAAAAPALPDLRAVAASDREHAEAARAAIRAIESAAR